jgi:hypothetical protein
MAALAELRRLQEVARTIPPDEAARASPPDEAARAAVRRLTMAAVADLWSDDFARVVEREHYAFNGVPLSQLAAEADEKRRTPAPRPEGHFQACVLALEERTPPGVIMAALREAEDAAARVEIRRNAEALVRSHPAFFLGMDVDEMIALTEETQAQLRARPPLSSAESALVAAAAMAAGDVVCAAAQKQRRMAALWMVCRSVDGVIDRSSKCESK